MSQVRAIRMNQQMERASGYEHILAMQQAQQRAEAAARVERPALAAIGLVLIVIGALMAVFSGGAFANGNAGATLLLALAGVFFLAVGLACVSLSPAQEAQPVVRRVRRYY